MKIGAFFHRTNLLPPNQTGLTLIEMSIVLAIFIVLTTLILSRFLNSPTIGNGVVLEDSQNVVAFLNLARATAEASTENDHWGIRFVDNGTTDCNVSQARDCLVMYKGTVFASRDTSYDRIQLLSASNQFGSLDTTDIYFTKRSGFAQNLPGYIPTPVARYSFASGYVADVSGNMHDGTMMSTATYQSAGCSRGSACYAFRGSCSVGGARCSYTSAPNSDDCAPSGGTCSGGYVSVPDHTDLKSTTFSISAWVYPQYFTPYTYPTVVAKGDASGSSGWSLYNEYTTSQLCFFVNDYSVANNVVCSANISTNSWHHIVATFDNASKQLKLYKDGEIQDSDTASLSLTPSSQPMTIGSDAGGAYLWQGRIDELMYFNRVLSVDDVSSLYSYTHPSTTSIEFPRLQFSITNGYASSTIYIGSDGAASYVL